MRRHPTAIIGGVMLVLLILMALLAPYLGTVDPQAISPVRRLRKPSETLLVRNRHAGTGRL